MIHADFFIPVLLLSINRSAMITVKFTCCCQRRIVACSLLSCLFFSSFAQAIFDPVKPQKKIVPFKITEQLNIDGRLDEAIWKSAAISDDFTGITPTQGGKPVNRTVVKVLYNDTYLYIAGICLDSGGKKACVFLTLKGILLFLIMTSSVL
jgi:hypothetical protein